MPDPGSGSQLPERSYFWNVANTVEHSYVQNLITHANNQRMKAKDDENNAQTIEITDAWWEKLQAMPFVSCK